jgi:hypothetical protein
VLSVQAIRKAHDDEFPPECSSESEAEEQRSPLSDSKGKACLRLPTEPASTSIAVTKTSPAALAPSKSPKKVGSAPKKAKKGAGNKAEKSGSQDALSEPRTVAKGKQAKTSADNKTAGKKGKTLADDEGKTDGSAGSAAAGKAKSPKAAVDKVCFPKRFLEKVPETSP